MKRIMEMKRKNVLLTGVIALATIFSACTKDEKSTGVVEGAPATLEVRIGGGESNKTRGINPEVTIPEEHKIHDFSVFVVNVNTGKIQSVQEFGSETKVVLKDLTSGEKRIVVIANASNLDLMLPKVGDYEDMLEQPARNIDIDEQSYAQMMINGFLMSGKISVTLQPGANAVQGVMEVKRTVAKVRLGRVVIAPAEGHTGVFTLKNVFIMKSFKYASYGAENIITQPYLVGGMLGNTTMHQSPNLIEPITNLDNEGRLFYVFPNEALDGHAETLLVVEGTYEGETRYFPIRINDTSGLTGSTSDGTFIKRNGQYTVNMTLKNLNNGSLDPETPVDPATLDFEVKAADWEVEMVQDIEV